MQRRKGWPAVRHDRSAVLARIQPRQHRLSAACRESAISAAVMACCDGTAGGTKPGQTKNEIGFSRRRHIPSPASAPRPMPCAKRPAADLHHHVRIDRESTGIARATCARPDSHHLPTVGGARSRARELFYISSCKGYDHASFSCLRHSVVCGECRERIGSHNSRPFRRKEMQNHC